MLIALSHHEVVVVDSLLVDSFFRSSGDPLVRGSDLWFLRLLDVILAALRRAGRRCS